MSKPHILIMNGPNLKALGLRQPHIYGTEGLEDIPHLVEKLLPQRVQLSFFQSNSEGALIDKLEKVYHARVASQGSAFSDTPPNASDFPTPPAPIDGIVLNAGAYTHTSLALADCLAWIDIPCVEVHVSNIWAREEPLRQQSLMGRHVVGVIAGFGIFGYALGVQALLHQGTHNLV